MNMQEDAKYLKRKITSGSIDVHPTEKALIVYYEVEATILAETGDPVLGDKKQCEKVIRVKSLNENTDIKTMARDIVEKCKLIHPSRLQEVEQVLYYLKKRKDVVSSKTENTQQQHSNNNNGEVPLEDPAFGGMDIKETANINDLEMYLEMLYDDLTERLRGTALILQLARNPENLDELCQNEILLGALARVLAEDWKNSTDLATNIIYIFFCFSSFTQLHPVVAHFQIGSLCMKIIEHELNAYVGWKEQVNRVARKEGEAGNSSKALQKAQKQFQQLTAKQEQLLRVAFYLLLNLAEDRKLEAKMHKKGVVSMLVKALDRQNNVELLILVLSFLKKLSIFVENKNSMAECGAVDKLAKIVNSNQKDDLTNITLRLLLNLSFDSSLRQQMVRAGLVARLVELLRNENNRLVSLCILYHISLDRNNRCLFATQECIHLLMKALLDSNRRQPEKEVLALSINLAADPSCARMMCDGKNLQHLMSKAFKTHDPLLAKMIKNISKHDDSEDLTPPPLSDGKGTSAAGNGERKKLFSIRKRFTDYVVEVAEQVKNAFKDAFASECLGILANMTDPELDFEMVLKEYKLVEWMKERLKPDSIANLDSSKDDLALEVVMLVGTACTDDTCAALFADSGIVQALIALLQAKQEDDEMVLQIVYVFYQMVFHQSTRDVIVTKTQAPAYLIDLMHDKNEEIRKVCSATLDIVAEHDDIWSKKIQMEKFRYHNLHWIEMIEMQHLHHGGKGEEEFMDDNLFFSCGNPEGSNFLGGYVEDASALDGADFFYGDHLRDRDDFDPTLYMGSLGQVRSFQDVPYDFPIFDRSPSVMFGERDYAAPGRHFGFTNSAGFDEDDGSGFGSPYYYGNNGR